MVSKTTRRYTSRKVGGRRRRVHRAGKMRGGRTKYSGGSKRVSYRRRQRGSGLGSMFGSLLGKVGGMSGALNGLGALANLGSGIAGMAVAGKQATAVDEERARAKQMHDIALHQMGYV